MQPEDGAGREGYADLRAAGEVAEIDYRRRSMKAQMRTANNEGYRYAVIIGDDEVQEGTVTLRDMHSGEQETIPQSDLIFRLRAEEKF